MSSRWRRKLRELDAAYGIARKISIHTVGAFLSELDTELSKGQSGTEKAAGPAHPKKEQAEALLEHDPDQERHPKAGGGTASSPRGSPPGASQEVDSPPLANVNLVARDELLEQPPPARAALEAESIGMDLCEQPPPTQAAMEVESIAKDSHEQPPPTAVEVESVASEEQVLLCLACGLFRGRSQFGRGRHAKEKCDECRRYRR